MSVGYSPSHLWRAHWPELRRKLEEAVTAGAARHPSGKATVWFRADDVGIPGRQSAEMFAVFRRHSVPLAPAVVPIWLNESRWDILRDQAGEPTHLWHWHQHGYRHTNHEKDGRKYEFGPSRNAFIHQVEITRGRRKLTCIMGEALLPAFTPPWNRMCDDALTSLPQCGITAVSRYVKAKEPCPSGVKDVPVRIDLHTRKDMDSSRDQSALLQEITAGLSEGVCGFMLHHQRMNRRALTFLDTLLHVLSHHRAVSICGLGDLLI